MMTLPQALEVEQSVLGEILVSGVTERFEGLKVDHFFQRSNRIIYQTFLDMESKGQKPDTVTVTSKLIDLQLINEVGGSKYISSLPYFTSGYPEQYVPILEEKLKLRRIIDAANIAITQADNQLESAKIISGLNHATICLEADDSTGSLTHKAVSEILKELEAKRRGETSFGLKTGILPIDTTLGGLKKSRYMVLAARAGKG
jgi:replicative DNA helicase